MGLNTVTKRELWDREESLGWVLECSELEKLERGWGPRKRDWERVPVK